MAKKSGMSMGQIILTIFAIVLSVAICIPLFVNVWNVVGSVGNTTNVEALGGYFEDYSSITDAFALTDTTFMAWASMVSGVALIVALVGAVLYIVGAIIRMVSNNKMATMMTKAGSIIMLIAGIVILIASILFVLPVSETTAFGATFSSSTALGFGACVGIIAPIGAGVLGLMTSRK